MWPTHCVQGTKGADFHSDLLYTSEDIVISKGQNERVDSYSGFGTHPEKTELNDILRNNNIQEVYCVGLAFDYCVGSTAIDAAKNGYQTYLIRDATRSVAKESEKIMEERLNEVGVKLIQSQDL